MMVARGSWLVHPGPHHRGGRRSSGSWSGSRRCPETLGEFGHELGELDAGDTGVDTSSPPRLGAGLGIEGLHVSHASRHVEEDDVLSLPPPATQEGLRGANGEDAHAEGGFGGARDKLAAGFSWSSRFSASFMVG